MRRPGDEPQLLRYGSHPSQFGWLRLPGSARSGQGLAQSWPVVVVIHGGFWRPRYGLDLGSPLAADLGEHGFASWNVEYRRVGDDPAAGGGGWPATCLDVAAAVDLLATAGQRAAGGRLDLSRVVGLGHSAGGQLVGWLAGRAQAGPDAPGAAPVVPLSGFVSQAGVLDLASAVADDLGAGAATAFLGADRGDAADRGDSADRSDSARRADLADRADLALASPIEQLPTGVPSVCVHGTADQQVPVSQSERYVAAARLAGDRSSLVRLDGVDHFALIDVTTTAWAACRTALLDLGDTGVDGQPGTPGRIAESLQIRKDG